MTLEDKVRAFRHRVLHRAQEPGNVSAACREAGISRTSYYRWKRRFTLCGIDCLHPRRTATHPGRAVQLDTTTERKIVATALSSPTWGPGRLSLQLEREGIVVSPTTVWRTLRRLGLGTRMERLLVLEVHSAKSAGLLTERTRQNLSQRKVRHVQAEKPGELVCIDTFYFGNLRGVGKLWQLTVCDAANSHAIAKVVVVSNAAEAAKFLRDVVAEEMKEAGRKLWRVLTDGGQRGQGRVRQRLPRTACPTHEDEAEACLDERIRRAAAGDDPAWTLAYRFRRRCFQLQASLDGFLHFCNFERPHQGYRTKGRTPAEVFWGAVCEQRHEEV